MLSCIIRIIVLTLDIIVYRNPADLNLEKIYLNLNRFQCMIPIFLSFFYSNTDSTKSNIPLVMSTSSPTRAREGLPGAGNPQTATVAAVPTSRHHEYQRWA